MITAGFVKPLGSGPKFVTVYLYPFVMFQKKTRIESVLHLSARLVERNKAFTVALKEKRPQHELKAIHSEIQEIYNHIALLNEAGERMPNNPVFTAHSY